MNLSITLIINSNIHRNNIDKLVNPPTPSVGCSGQGALQNNYDSVLDKLMYNIRSVGQLCDASLTTCVPVNLPTHNFWVVTSVRSGFVFLDWALGASRTMPGPKYLQQHFEPAAGSKILSARVLGKMQRTLQPVLPFPWYIEKISNSDSTIPNIDYSFAVWCLYL